MQLLLKLYTEKNTSLQLFPQPLRVSWFMSHVYYYYAHVKEYHWHREKVSSCFHINIDKEKMPASCP